MRNIILIMLMTSVSGIAWAEWKKIIGGANSTGYADLDTRKKNGSFVTMQVLVDYKKPPFDGNNLPYLSLTMLSEYQCVEKQFRTLAIASHAGNMGQGEQPYKTDEPSEWEPLAAGTIQKELWKAACGK